VGRSRWPVAGAVATGHGVSMLRIGIASVRLLFALAVGSISNFAQFTVSDLPKLRDYESKRASSYARDGSNHDYENLQAGKELVLFNEAGPGEIRHIWITMASPEAYHLKKIVLRMYWDGKPSRASKHLSAISSVWVSAHTRYLVHRSS
jgi:hypothetical protein